MNLHMRDRYWFWRADRKRAKMSGEQAMMFARVTHDMLCVCKRIPWAREAWPHACYEAACAILNDRFDKEAMQKMEEFFQIGPFDDCMICWPADYESVDNIRAMFPGAAVAVGDEYY